MTFGIAYWRRFLNSSKQDPIREATVGKEKTEKADFNQERKELVRDELADKSKPFVSSSFSMTPKSSSSEKANGNPAIFVELDSDKSAPRGDATEPLEVESEAIPKVENEMQITYTTEDLDEENILWEELQIANEALLEPSLTAILVRDLSRIS